MQLPKENQDYEFIPVNNDEWQVRFLTGPYPETVISYGKVTAFENESSDDATLKFDFTVHSSPDKQLTDKDAGLQNYAGDVLVSILESSIDNKEVIITPSEDKWIQI